MLLILQSARALAHHRRLVYTTVGWLDIAYRIRVWTSLPGKLSRSE
jgi:hypothetical protein